TKACELPQRNHCGPASGYRFRQRDWQILEHLDVVALSVREANDDLKPPVAFKDHAGVASPDRDADYVLNGRQAEAAARDLALIDIDLQDRHSGHIFHLDLCSAANAAKNSRNLIGGAPHRLKFVAKHLDGEVLLHAGNQLVETHLNRLRK